MGKSWRDLPDEMMEWIMVQADVQTTNRMLLVARREHRISCGVALHTTDYLRLCTNVRLDSPRGRRAHFVRNVEQLRMGVIEVVCEMGICLLAARGDLELLLGFSEISSMLRGIGIAAASEGHQKVVDWVLAHKGLTDDIIMNIGKVAAMDGHLDMAAGILQQFYAGQPILRFDVDVRASRPVHPRLIAENWMEPPTTVQVLMILHNAVKAPNFKADAALRLIRWCEDPLEPEDHYFLLYHIIKNGRMDWLSPFLKDAEFIIHGLKDSVIRDQLIETAFEFYRLDMLHFIAVHGKIQPDELLRLTPGTVPIEGLDKMCNLMLELTASSQQPSL